MCLILFPFTKDLNSAEVNCGPLSVTICSGSPYAANSSRSLTTVFDVDVVVISKTSGHLEWASMMTKNEVPIKRPAKSRCSLCHGLAGQVHGCDGARGGACLVC